MRVTVEEDWETSCSLFVSPPGHRTPRPSHKLLKALHCVYLAKAALGRGLAAGIRQLRWSGTTATWSRRRGDAQVDCITLHHGRKSTAAMEVGLGWSGGGRRPLVHYAKYRGSSNT